MNSRNIPSSSYEYSTLVELLRLRAFHQGQQRAYTFLSEGKEELHLSYGELDQRAREVAACLQSHNIAPGERVLLLFHPGLDYIVAFWGCLYAQVVAVPIYPPQRSKASRSGERLQWVIEDSLATAALTVSTLAPLIQETLAPFQSSRRIQLLPIDAISPSVQWQERPFTEERIAFVQYTSGTTSQPKGVVLSHKNLLHNLEAIYSRFGNSHESKGVIWLPPYHDMGLIGGILEPLYGGFPVILMAPMTFLRSPLRWLETISRARATTSGGPNFAYEFCINRITPEQREDLDLSSWEVAFNGAEPIRKSTLDRFVEAFAPCGFRREAFYPCYGLAEATLYVSGGHKSAPPTIGFFQARDLEKGLATPAQEDDKEIQTVVGCGHPLPDQRLLIVDPQSRRLCSEYQVGEIWLQGASVASAYWNKRAETEAILSASLEEGGAGPFLRTGDLGFLVGEELFVTGRLKDLLIIRGRNYYPQDIERTVEECSPALVPEGGAAFTMPIAEEERLVIVHEVARHHRADDLGDLFQTMQYAVSAEHELQVYSIALIKVGSLPRTSSGKIQRQLCRSLYLNDQLAVVGAVSRTVQEGNGVRLTRAMLNDAPSTEREALLEAYLIALVAQTTKIPFSSEEKEKPLVSFGLDSLGAAELQHRLATDLYVAVPIEKILRDMSITQLLTLAWQQCSNEPSLLPSMKPDTHQADEFLLSQGQQALWFLHQAQPSNPAYTLVRAVRLAPITQLSALQQAFQSLVDRHNALRTHFPLLDGQPMRLVQQYMEVSFEIKDITAWSSDELEHYLHATTAFSFDLEHGPLFKVTLLTRPDSAPVLILMMHHLIGDLWSLSLLFSELGRLYSAYRNNATPDLPSLSCTYTDYVHWQNEMLASDRKAHLQAYWQQQLAEVPASLALPYDYPRQLLQTRESGVERSVVDEQMLQQIQLLCRKEGVTVYVFLLAAFALLLQGYTHQEDILIGSPFSQRNQPDFVGLVGFLVNTLPLRVRKTGSTSFISLLQQVKKTVIEAFEHQDYPFHMLVQQLHLERKTDQSGFLQVLFAMQNMQVIDEQDISSLILSDRGPTLQLGALQIEPLRIDATSTQWDLSLTLAPSQKGLMILAEYDQGLFQGTTIRYMLQNFADLLQALTDNPTLSFAHLEMLSSEECQQIKAWNATDVRFPEMLNGLHQIFVAQARRSPDALAVVSADNSLTYAQLDQKTDLLAHLLRKQGVGAETLVCICMERSVEMMIGLLGILKAGGAYVPLDPTYPPERMARLLEDTQTPLVLTQQHLGEQLRLHDIPLLSLDTRWEDLCPDKEPLLSGEVLPDQAAYVIYTSGSTGVPKGVINTHRGICNRLLWMQSVYQLQAADRVLQKTPYTFDVSVWEFFWPLLTGAQVVMAHPEGHQDSTYLVQVIAAQQITTLHFVPSMLAHFIREETLEQCTALKRIICSGEVLPSDLMERCMQSLDIELHNLYGPTEAAVDVTFWGCKPLEQGRTVPIGQPIANTEIYLLNDHLQRVPLVALGEVYIGGVNLARGYLGRADMTAERFVPHPFGQTPGARLYRTGDVGRYRADGTLEYLGRQDHQVKVRGFRIELGEIEATLAGHPDVREVVVHAREDTPGDRQLVAYITLEPEEEPPSVGALQSFVKERLPRYMVPSAFVFLETIPLKRNGKIDRQALPAPGDARPCLENSFVAPRNALEARMTAIWIRVLGKTTIGIDDNFFELGGDSMRSIQVVSQANKEGLYCSVQLLFLYQTVRELVEHLRPNAGVGQSSPSAFGLLTPEDSEKLGADRKLADAYPLTLLQAGLIFHSQFSANYEIYVTSLHLAMPFQQELFSRTLEHLFERHDMLRTRFDMANFSEPLQLVEASTPPKLFVYAIHDLSPAQQQQEIEQWIHREKTRQVVWEEAPLVHFSVHLRSERAFQLTLSEPLLDGWSVALLLSELLTNYAALLQSSPLPLAGKLHSRFCDYVALEQTQLATEQSQSYWQKKVSGASTYTFPRRTDRVAAEKEERIYRHDMLLPADLSDALKGLALQASVPLKSVLLAAHLKVTALLSGETDVLTGIIANARPERSDGEKIIGIFLNALPLRVPTMVNTWLELIKKAFEAEQEFLPYRHYPLAKIQQQNGGQNLFETLFNFTHFHVYQLLEQAENIHVLDGYASEQTFFPLTAQFNLDHKTSHIHFALDCDPAVLSRQQTEMISQYYLGALSAMVAAPHIYPDNLQILSSKARHHLLQEWNSAEVAPPLPAALLGLFEARAEQMPSKIAVTDGKTELTYRELDQKANQLAHLLQLHGVGPDVCVGICLERSCELIVAVLGVLKAGGAYVPLDPTYPRQRLVFMFQEARISVLVAHRHLLELLPDEAPVVLTLEGDWTIGKQLPCTRPTSLAMPAHLAYVVYTSGSTGQPKGVAVTRNSVLALVHWSLATYQAEHLSKVLASTSLCFDLSVYEIFVPLSAGGTIVLVKDLFHLLEMAQHQRITLVNTVPSLLAEMLQMGALPADVRVVNLCGEPLTRSLVQKLYQHRTLQYVYNLYGPSEDTTYSSSLIANPEATGDPPIGRPISGTQMYVLDAQMQLLPTGVPGELYLGGMGLARGYLSHPDLTAVRFVPNPYSKIPGSRLYRTGDLVRYTSEGDLEYIGRVDQQIKLHGYRIELGEIEAALVHHPVVREAVVIVRENARGEKYLLAYIILMEACKQPESSELREFLKQKLPQYMLPDDFILLEAFPLTLNGKIDRRALPAPAALEKMSERVFVAPETPLEREVARIFSEVLRCEQVGLLDNFFGLGGNSLSATQAVARLRVLSQIDLPLAQFFQAESVKEVAVLLEDLQAKREREELLATIREVEELADDDLVRMLLEKGITVNSLNESAGIYGKS